MQYCAVGELKERLDITGNTYDAQLDTYVSAVSEWVDLYCKRPLGAFRVEANSTRYYDACRVGGRCLTLDATILSVASLTNGDGLVLAADAYRLMPRNRPRYYEIHLLTSYGWSFTTNDSEITILGKFGYSLTPPGPVKEATLQYAAWIFKKYQAAMQDATVNFDLGQLQYSKRIPDSVLALLDQYVDRSNLL